MTTKIPTPPIDRFDFGTIVVLKFEVAEPEPRMVYMPAVQLEGDQWVYGEATESRLVARSVAAAMYLALTATDDPTQFAESDILEALRLGVMSDEEAESLRQSKK